MARMYPDVFPLEEWQADDKGLCAEKEVYEHLRDTLPSNWVVFYNQWRYFLKTDGKYPTYVNYEADFVVLVPGKGIAVLEVKSWYKPEIRDGVWYHRGEQGQLKKCDKGSPINQAFLASKSLRTELIKKLSLFGDGKLECRPLAILHGTAENYEKANKACSHDEEAAKRINKHLDDCFEVLYVMGTEALNNIKQRIENIFIYNNVFNLHHVETISEYLLNNIRIKNAPSTCIKVLDRAVEGLAGILPRLEKSIYGIHVSGCAGSGKTWMACAEAKRLHAKNKKSKILFLCYNRNLADRILEKHMAGVLAETLIAKKDGKSSPSVTTLSELEEVPIHVDTFHSLCRYLCERGKIPFQQTDGKIKKETLKQVFSSLKNCRELRYDYIFVDEAQDMRDEWWIYVINPLRKSPIKPLYAFSDANQLIFNDGQKEVILPVRVSLNQNLRNTYDIAQLSRAVLPEEKRDIISFALKTDVLVCCKGLDTEKERADQVKCYIDEILEKYKDIRKKDIVVLSPYIANSSFNFLTDEVAIPKDGESPEDSKKRINDCLFGEVDKVLGETVRAFKGLEAPFVILTDVNCPGGVGFTINDFYVACTRAKYGLYIVPTVSGNKYIEKLKTIADSLD